MPQSHQRIYPTGLPSFDSLAGGLRAGMLVGVNSKLFGLTVLLRNGSRTPVLVLKDAGALAQFGLDVMDGFLELRDPLLDPMPLDHPLFDLEEEIWMSDWPEKLACTPMVIEQRAMDFLDVAVQVREWAKSTGGGPVILAGIPNTESAGFAAKDLATECSVPLIAEVSDIGVFESGGGLARAADVVLVFGTRINARHREENLVQMFKNASLAATVVMSQRRPESVLIEEGDSL